MSDSGCRLPPFVEAIFDHSVTSPYDFAAEAKKRIKIGVSHRDFRPLT